jgi:hypothetical protein
MDLGASWQLLSSMPTCTTLTAARSGNLYAVEDAPATFSFSSDNGSTWTSKDYFGGLVDTTQYAITVFSTIQELSATSFLAGSNNGVFISNDTGNTWRNASQGLPYIPRSFLLSPAKPSFIDTLLGFPNTPAIVGNAHGVVFLGCSAGIYRSVDSGKTWQPYGQGMPSGVPINTLLMDNGGFLYAGTDDGTVFKTSQTTVGVIDPGETIPLDWKLEQNYPNPFNPSTIIGYQISKPSKVDLKVYDLLGREVALLVNEQKSAGRYEARWDASRFATGVYFATIRAGNFAKTIKLLLMK